MRGAQHTPRQKHSSGLPRGVAGAGLVVLFLMVYVFVSAGLRPREGWSAPSAAKLPATDALHRKLVASSEAMTHMNVKNLDIMDKLLACTTFECLKELQLNDKQLKDTKFKVPHFMIIGWQKCATTSLFRYLVRHPEVVKPLFKEPHYFTSCQFGGKACKALGGISEAGYIRDTLQIDMVAASGLTLAAMDASVDYAQYGEELAITIKENFPWVKLVFALREPVSRAMSWKVMMAQKFDKGCKSNDKLAACLINTLDSRNYSEPLEGWLKVFPKDQIHVMQFEELLKNPERELLAMKEFLGLDPAQPRFSLEDGFSNVNSRTSDSPGWNISKVEYDEILEPIIQDAHNLAALLEKYKIGDGKKWVKNWQEVWDSNYATCGKDGMCGIKSG